MNATLLTVRSGQDPLRETLRQMLAVLDSERQALAALDLDTILGAAVDKEKLCNRIEAVDGFVLDEECRSMLETARRQNEVNRQVRNIIAANVSTRLNTLTGAPQVYQARARVNGFVR